MAQGAVGRVRKERDAIWDMGSNCWQDMVMVVRSEQIARKPKDIRAKFRRSSREYEGTYECEFSGELRLRMQTRIRLLFANLSYIMTYSSYKLRGTDFFEFEVK